MIGYVTCGTNDIVRSGEFYDQIFAMLGAQRVHSDDTSIAWKRKDNTVVFAVVHPFDGKPASFGNGTMVAFCTSSKEQVNALHQKALDLGASDEGAPGIRSGGFYCAYVRDMDGNKLNFHFNPNKGSATHGQ